MIIKNIIKNIISGCRNTHFTQSRTLQRLWQTSENHEVHFNVFHSGDAKCPFVDRLWSSSRTVKLTKSNLRNTSGVITLPLFKEDKVASKWVQCKLIFDYTTSASNFAEGKYGFCREGVYTPRLTRCCWCYMPRPCSTWQSHWKTKMHRVSQQGAFSPPRGYWKLYKTNTKIIHGNTFVKQFSIFLLN